MFRKPPSNFKQLKRTKPEGDSLEQNNFESINANKITNCSFEEDENHTSIVGKEFLRSEENVEENLVPLVKKSYFSSKCDMKDELEKLKAMQNHEEVSSSKENKKDLPNELKFTENEINTIENAKKLRQDIRESNRFNISEIKKQNNNEQKVVELINDDDYDIEIDTGIQELDKIRKELEDNEEQEINNKWEEDIIKRALPKNKIGTSLTLVHLNKNETSTFSKNKDISEKILNITLISVLNKLEWKKGEIDQSRLDNISKLKEIEESYKNSELLIKNAPELEEKHKQKCLFYSEFQEFILSLEDLYMQKEENVQQILSEYKSKMNKFHLMVLENQLIQIIDINNFSHTHFSNILAKYVCKSKEESMKLIEECKLNDSKLKLEFESKYGKEDIGRAFFTAEELLYISDEKIKQFVNEINNLNKTINEVFIDVNSEFSSLENIIDKLTKWKESYLDDFKECDLLKNFISLISFYINIKCFDIDIFGKYQDKDTKLNENEIGFQISKLNWYINIQNFFNSYIDKDNKYMIEVLNSSIALILKPIILDQIKYIWNPLSTGDLEKLNYFLKDYFSILRTTFHSDNPETVNECQEIYHLIIERIKETIDLFSEHKENNIKVWILAKIGINALKLESYSLISVVDAKKIKESILNILNKIQIINMDEVLDNYFKQIKNIQ